MIEIDINKENAKNIVIYLITYILFVYYIFNIIGLYDYYTAYARSEAYRSSCGTNIMESEKFRYELLMHNTSECYMLIFYLVYVIIVSFLIFINLVQGVDLISDGFYEAIKYLLSDNVRLIREGSKYIPTAFGFTLLVLLTMSTAYFWQNFTYIAILKRDVGPTGYINFGYHFMIAGLIALFFILKSDLFEDPNFKNRIMSTIVLALYLVLFGLMLTPHIVYYDRITTISEDSNETMLDYLITIISLFIIFSFGVILLFGMVIPEMKGMLYLHVVFVALFYIFNLIMLGLYFNRDCSELIDLTGLFGLEHKPKLRRYKLIANITFFILSCCMLFLFRDQISNGNIVALISLIIAIAIIFEWIFGTTHIIQKSVYDLTGYSREYKNKLLDLNEIISEVIEQNRKNKREKGNHTIPDNIEKVSNAFTNNLDFCRSQLNHFLESSELIQRDRQYTEYCKIVFNKKKHELYTALNNEISKDTKYNFGLNDIFNSDTMSLEYSERFLALRSADSKTSMVKAVNDLINSSTSIKTIREEFNSLIENPNSEEGQKIEVSTGRTTLEDLIIHNYNIRNDHKIDISNGLTEIEINGKKHYFVNCSEEQKQSCETVRNLGCGSASNVQTEDKSSCGEQNVKNKICNSFPAENFACVYLPYFDNDLDKFISTMELQAKSSAIEFQNTERRKRLNEALFDIQRYCDNNINSNIYIIMFIVILCITIILIASGFVSLGLSYNKTYMYYSQIVAMIGLAIFIAIFITAEVLFKKI